MRVRARRRVPFQLAAVLGGLPLPTQIGCEVGSAALASKGVSFGTLKRTAAGERSETW
jgi:hypothetical protein